MAMELVGETVAVVMVAGREGVGIDVVSADVEFEEAIVGTGIAEVTTAEVMAAVAEEDEDEDEATVGTETTEVAAATTEEDEDEVPA